MRSRMSLFALLLAVGAFALPLAAHAAIPFFGPIIPQAGNQATCAAGWGMLMIVINNIISFLITLAIVFVAPIMIAYAGFLFVVNPVNPSGRSRANGILTNTVVGIIIALVSYLIVDAVMAVLYNPTAVGKTWSALITTSGDICIDLKGSLAPAPPVPTPGVAVVPGACSVSPLSQLTDSLALQMESGQTVIWSNTDPRLQTCVNKFIGQVGGTVTSAYRPPAYQTHLWEVRDRWCMQGLQSNAEAICSSLKSSVSAELSKHGLSCDRPVATVSNHSAGTAVDITGIVQGSQSVLSAANNSCLTWFGTGDPVHYTLKSSCTCN